MPEGLFDQTPAGGYIKVPACYECNNGYSRDEEYFLVAVLAEATARSSAANRVLDRLAEDHRTGRRKRTGLALALLERIRPVDVYSPGGIYLGSAEGVEIDIPRANRPAGTNEGGDNAANYGQAKDNLRGPDPEQRAQRQENGPEAALAALGCPARRGRDIPRHP